MAKKKPPKPGYAKQGSRAQFNNLGTAFGVKDTNPPGTAYVMGSNNLGYGVVAAYDANNNFLGFVRGNLNDGVRVNYDGSGAATGINMPGDPPPTSGGGGGDDGNKRPAFTTGYTPDSVYDETLASIAARRQMALNAATEGERALSNDYGLGINQDGSGATYTGQWAASDQNQLGIDPSNPFSRASLLNKSYFVAGKVGEGSYANRGLLTSGAYQRNQSRDTFRFEGGKDSLLKSFASQLQDYRQRRAQAEADARAAQSQASYDLFNRRRDEYDRMYPN